MSESGRVAVVANGRFYVGPELCRHLAARHHRLVIGDPDPELVTELEAAGVEVVAVRGVADLSDPASSAALVDAAMTAYGRIDAAVAFSGVIVTGRFMKSTVEDLETVTKSCLTAPYHFLQAVLAPMIAAEAGQVLVITSASGARPTPGAPLYSSVRAAANMLVRNVAAEMARHQIQVNAVGTNFMDFPEFLRASGADDPEVRSRIEAQVPLGRLGTMPEFASFCMPYVDGSSGFTTGQFVAYAGGWA